jgi:trimethylguanosine synthase
MLAIVEKVRYWLNYLFHYQVCPFGPDLQETWNHRFELFNKFDAGIKTDTVGLYSVTPEKHARQIAAHLADKTVIDAFCGIGGSAITLAEACLKVYAIDIDKNRLEMARHNASVYGVDNIEFINADFFKAINGIIAEAVFLDPPWGGPSYIDKVKFTLADFSPDGNRLLDTSFQYFKTVVLRVPPQFDFRELDRYHRKFQVKPNNLAGRLISYTIYFSHAET